MGNRAGRRAQPNPSPAYIPGGAYAPAYYSTSDYPLRRRPPYQANYRRQCYAYPQQRPYYY